MTVDHQRHNNQVKVVRHFCLRDEFLTRKNTTETKQLRHANRRDRIGPHKPIHEQRT